MKKLNKVKTHNLGFSLGPKGLIGIGIITFDDNTCRAIEIIDNGSTTEGGKPVILKVGQVHFASIQDLYDFIANKKPDGYYEEIEVDE